MFLLNSCLSLFSAACRSRLPFSRSYGYILPSSLAMLLPSALGFSPHPPVSVYGTGRYHTIAAFLDRSSGHFTTLFRSASHSSILKGVFSLSSCHACPGLLSRAVLITCVPTVLMISGAGISTCCPSATPFGLVLGPDFPRADQLYPGILGYSA